MTATEAIALLRAAGMNPVPGPWDGTWETEVEFMTVRFGIPADGIGWYAIWPGLDDGSLTKAWGSCLISALRSLSNRLLDAREKPGSGGAARRIHDLVTRLEAGR